MHLQEAVQCVLRDVQRADWLLMETSLVDASQAVFSIDRLIRAAHSARNGLTGRIDQIKADMPQVLETLSVRNINLPQRLKSVVAPYAHHDDAVIIWGRQDQRPEITEQAHSLSPSDFVCFDLQDENTSCAVVFGVSQ